MKVAIVHDYLNQWGGAERVVDALHELYPDAPIYTLIYDPLKTRGHFNSWDIRTSFLQRPLISRFRKFTLPLGPLAVESFELSDFDVVISSSASLSKGVITPPHTLHICYCHTPTAYLWSWTHRYLAEQRLGTITEAISRLILHRLRQWDRLAAERVDVWVANSKNVKERIKKYYRKDSVVIYPPVDVNRFALSYGRRDTFLYISRLSGYKRPDLVVSAFNDLRLPLTVIGEGDEQKRLKAIAGPNITFKGWLSDAEVTAYMSRARALIFPVEEDFGIVPVEAMAAGTPVIALGRGGALETVVDGVTGIFFPEQSVKAVISAVKRFQRIEPLFKPLLIKKQAERFERAIFLDRMGSLVAKSFKEHKSKRGQRQTN